MRPIGNTVLIIAGLLAATACGQARLDPCEFLTVDEVATIDSTVSTARWAGRQEPKADNEVCIFYNASGDARVMLFVWYENDSPVSELVAAGSGNDARLRPFSGTDLEGFASFGNGNLELLAARSAARTVGLRVRAHVSEGSENFSRLVALAQAAGQR